MERKIYNLIRKICVDEQMPTDWEDGIIYPIYKKCDRSVCNNYRGITLWNVTYKIFTCLLLNRLQKIAEKEIGNYQTGFRTNRSTIDHTGCNRRNGPDFGRVFPMLNYTASFLSKAE